MPDKRPGTSLAYKLNAKLFFRQIIVTVWLDVVICALFAGGLLYYAETTALTLMAEMGVFGVGVFGAGAGGESDAEGASGAASTGVGAESANGAAGAGAGRNRGGEVSADESQAPGQAPMDVRDTPSMPISPNDGVLYSDISRVVYWSRSEPAAQHLSADILTYLPEKLTKSDAAWLAHAAVGRWLYYDASVTSWVAQAESLVYVLSVENAGAWLIAETDLGFPLFCFIRGFAVLLMVEILSAFHSLRQNGRRIRRTLRPLQELTASARALSATGNQLSPEALKRMTGALDSINVSHLDARLPLSGVSEELRPLAAAINEMLTRIDEAYREQIRFVSDASHELRTPIAVIQGYADLLSRWGTEDPETMKEAIAAIRQEATAMKEMVEQLLFLARGERDFMEVDWQRINISALVAEVFREIEMIDETHRFDASIEPAVFVEGDDGLLKQLMRILVDNSMKYTPAGGRISLRVEKRDRQAALIVQDEGSGIPEKAIPHIFDRFYRADESRTRETGGSGLGLSIAKWIARRHDGAIEVTSREGIGTRMTVLLPLHSGD